MHWVAAAGGGRRISLTVTGGQRPFTTATTPPGRRSVDRILSQAGAKRPLALDAPWRRTLNDALLPPELLELLTGERRDSGRPLRLRLAVPADELHQQLRDAPWEMCTLGGWRDSGFNGMPTELSRHQDVHIVREVALGGAGPQPGHPLAGRIVVASAYAVGGVIDGYAFEPLHQGNLSDADAVGHELRRTALSAELVSPGEQRQGISAHDLAQALARGGVDGFYFAGHHGPGGLVLAGPGPGGDRCPAWLNISDLARNLMSAGVTVAVLMACQTAVALESDSPGDRASSQRTRRAFAEELTAAGVPWVVSAQRDISSEESRQFGPIFFRWLAYGATVDEAACEACKAMGERSGLIVVHTYRGCPDPIVHRPPDPGHRELAYWLGWRPDNHPVAVPRLERNPRHRVSIDVLWGLDRSPFRALLAAAESEFVLEERLNRAEQVIQQGAFDFDREEVLQRRGWFGIQSAAYPAVSVDELHAMVGDRTDWVPSRDAAQDGAGLGFVLTWAPRAEADVHRVLEHLDAIATLLPAAAIVVRIGCAPGDDERAALELNRRLPRPVDVLAAPPGPAPDDESWFDGAVLSGHRLPSRLYHATESADSLALASLRHREALGWRKVWQKVRAGTSEPVRVVADYLATAGVSAVAALEFLCASPPEVVAAAWRAGLRPDFAPSRLPPGAARMPGTWALLARSRLTPELVCWLYERGSPLASIPGLMAWPEKDQAFEAWLPQLRAAYRPVPLAW